MDGIKQAERQPPNLPRQLRATGLCMQVDINATGIFHNNTRRAMVDCGRAPCGPVGAIEILHPPQIAHAAPPRQGYATNVQRTAPAHAEAIVMRAVM